MESEVGYRIAQNFGGESFGEFGEFSVICQSFTLPKMPLENCDYSV